MLADTNQPVAITAKSRSVAVQGMGGIGKTVLATALARDEEVRRAFPDGVIWITFGQTPQILTWQSHIAKALGDNQAAFTEISLAKARLRELLTGKTCLLILDDVWNLEHASAFNVLEEGCQMLITTRDAGIITGLGGKEYQLSLLNEQQALALLANWAEQAVETLPATAIEVARECGYLPLALSMVGAMMRGKPTNRWQNVLEKLRSAELEKIRQQFLDYPYPDLFKAIHVSVEALEPEERERYLDFAVFREDTPIPEAVLQTFWEPLELDEFDTQDVIDELVSKSLALRDEKGNLSLHDLQFDYVRKQVTSQNPTPASETLPLVRRGEGVVFIGGLGLLHNRLLNAYTQKYPNSWHSLENDGYIFEQLAHHLIKAGRATELQQLLFDFRWLQAKLENSNINELIADYNLLPEDTNLQLLRRTLLLSVNILAKDKRQLAGQLWGRLQCFAASEIQQLLQQAQQNKTTWLRPLTPSLTPPGGSLLRILTGHTDSVRAVAVTPDGKYVISASSDKTLKVWDLQTGVGLRTLEGHGSYVNAVAVTPDSKYVISGSLDRTRTLKIWDLQTGVGLRTLEGHGSYVNAVAVTPDGKYVISGSDDKTLKIWDLQTGVGLRTFEGHTSSVNAVAITPDGKYVISGSDDNTLKVWDLQTGVGLRTLEDHRNRVNAVAVTPNSKYVISASWDNTLKVWDLQTGIRLLTLEGHGSYVNTVAVTPDGKYIISGSLDSTVKVWDLQTGLGLLTLEGHSSYVTAVAVTPDGKYIISGSNDNTLKVWDLQTRSILPTLEGHSSHVNAVAVTPDSKYVISASWDFTLKLWDLQTGVGLRTLEGHSHSVNAVAITPDSKYVISSSHDTTLKVWDLQIGVEVRTLEGHTDSVNVVAITPDSKYVISSSHDATLIVWDWQTGEIVYILQGNNNWLDAVAVTPDSKYVISSFKNNTLKIWDLQTGSIVDILQGHSDSVSAIAVTLNSKYVISGSKDSTLKVWDLQTGEILRTLEGHSSSVLAVAVTPDSKYAISGSLDFTLKVWDLQTGIGLRTLEGHCNCVNMVDITPDGKYVISGSRDNTLKVWDWQTGEVIATFTGDGGIKCCAVAGDGISIVAGEASGRVHFLRLEGMQSGKI